MKKCPFCAEEIQDEAIKCKHCGSAINGNSEVSQKLPEQPDQIYFYIDSNSGSAIEGPLPEVEAKNRVVSKSIGYWTLCWKQGWDNWKLAGETFGLPAPPPSQGKPYQGPTPIPPNPSLPNVTVASNIDDEIELLVSIKEGRPTVIFNDDPEKARMFLGPLSDDLVKDLWIKPDGTPVRPFQLCWREGWSRWRTMNEVYGKGKNSIPSTETATTIPSKPEDSKEVQKRPEDIPLPKTGTSIGDIFGSLFTIVLVVGFGLLFLWGLFSGPFNSFFKSLFR